MAIATAQPASDAKMAVKASSAAATASKGGYTAGIPIGIALWSLITAGYVAFYLHCQHMTVDEFMDYCSWTVPATMMALYLVVVVFLGPKLIKEELTFGGRLKDIMLTYNAYQVICNTWWCASVAWGLYERGQPMLGAKLDRSNTGFNAAFMIYFHYNNKFIEYFDTIFMVLRAKNNQVTFLHVYHHALMGWAWFAVVKTWAGGDSWFGAWANSFIHIMMYAYYFMAAIGVPCPWKKVITKMQLVQFVICFVHGWSVIYYQTTPSWLALFQIYVMTTMFILFSNFYMKQYKNKKPAAAVDGEKKKA